MVGTALCGLTVLATTWTLLATGWVDGAGGILVVGVAAVLEAAVLAYARVPRLIALLLVPILSLAAIIPATISALPFDGDTTFLHLIGRYAGAAFTGLSSSQDWAFTVGLSAILWICGYWVAWVALREHRGVLAVIPIYIVLATNVLNAHAGRTPALPTVLTLGITLLVISNAHLDSLEARWQRRNVLPLPGIRSGMVGSTAILAAGILLLGSLLPRLTTTDISGQFFTNGGGGTGHGGSGGDSGGGGSASIGFSAVTQPGGPLLSNPKPVFTYTLDTNAPVYLRGVNDAVFLGGNWYPDRTDSSFGNGFAFRGIDFKSGTLPRDSVAADGAAAAESALVTAQIVLKPGSGNSDLALFPGEAQRTGGDGIAYGTVDLGAGGSELLTVDSVHLNGGIRAGTTLVTAGTVSAATAAELRVAGTSYPAFTQRYTQLSDDDTQALAVIGRMARQWSAGTTNPYDAAAAIEAQLRSPAFTYTLTPPNAHANEWPILYFLTNSHRGYCQYFASSMGAMLRSIGIPTRLVNGYGPGTPTTTTNRKGQRAMQVTTSDAHTWVEVYFPKYGWIPFEPTPPSAQGQYEIITRGSAAIGGAGATPGSSDLPPGFNEPSQPTLPPNANTTVPATPARPAPPAPDLRPVGFGILIGIGALVALTVLWLLLPRSQRGAWRRLEVVGWLLGMRRHPDETHRGYAHRFATALSPGWRRREKAGGEERRAHLRNAVSDLADASAENEFSRPGSESTHAQGIRRLWVTILRATPSLLWRAVARRLAPS